MAESNFPDNAKFEIRDDLVVEQVDDEFLVLDLQGNEYFGLNAVARSIWSALKDGSTYGEVVDAVVADFEVERERVAADVAEFLRDAQAHGLVSRTDA